jgi:hypothetical protein
LPPDPQRNGGKTGGESSSFTHTPSGPGLETSVPSQTSGQSSEVNAGDKAIRFILNDQRSQTSQLSFTKSSLPRGQHRGAAYAAADRDRLIRPESVLARDSPNFGGDEGRIYGQKRVRSEIGKFSMYKGAFQSLLVNLHFPDVEDEETVKSKELELLANSQQLLQKVYQALGTMNASQRDKSFKFLSAVDDSKFLLTFDSGSEIYYYRLRQRNKSSEIKDLVTYSCRV